MSLVVLLTYAVSAGAQSPWTLTIKPSTTPLATGACTPVQLDLVDASGKEAPRNPAGARVSMADFDMSVTGAAVVGRYDGASAWSACACPTSAGATATILATYPAKALADRARVPGVAFQSSITVPVVAGRSSGVPIGCEAIKTTTAGAAGAAPWTVTLASDVSALPIGACTPIRIDLRDASGKNAPRNPSGQLLSFADFDMTVTTSGGGAVVGQADGATIWSACACQDNSAGALATITASYPASALADRARVTGVAFRSSVTIPLSAARGTFNPPACAAQTTRPASPVPAPPISRVAPAVTPPAASVVAAAGAAAGAAGGASGGAAGNGAASGAAGGTAGGGAGGSAGSVASGAAGGAAAAGAPTAGGGAAVADGRSATVGGAAAGAALGAGSGAAADAASRAGAAGGGGAGGKADGTAAGGAAAAAGATGGAGVATGASATNVASGGGAGGASAAAAGTAGGAAAAATGTGASKSTSALLAETRVLQRQVQTDVAQLAPAVLALSNSLSAVDRQEIQNVCAALTANPNDEQAKRRLAKFLAQQKNQSLDAVVRLCLAPSYTRLQGEMQSSAQALEGRSDAGGDAPVELQDAARRQQQAAQMLNNLSKTLHETMLKIIQNIRG